MRYFVLVVTMLIGFTGATAQVLQEIIEADREGQAIRIAFYNVENLFDTLDNGGVDDAEFLPRSEKKWDSSKYRIKLANMAKTIRAIGGWQAPELVGLVEIENRSVMLDLVNHPALRAANYEIVHYDSDDPRGIDVGVLYNPQILERVYSKPLEMREENVRTRDILYVKFVVAKLDTMHVFVNHWPSRRGGKLESEPKRLMAANVLKRTTDSILNRHPAANILLMGDFNDTPTDKSILLFSKTEKSAFTNLMQPLPNSEGSHKYRGVWDYLDQIIVSPGLFNSANQLRLSAPKAYVFRAEFLLEPDERNGDVYPFRTWKGPSFTAGFSDHLPVFTDVYFH